MIRILAVSALLSTTAAHADPVRYELDPDHTTVAFLVQHVGYAGTLGQFTDVQGGFTYDIDTQELSDVSVTVNTDSVTTLHEKRDEHVRSGDFLDTGGHPQMIFTADQGTAESGSKGKVSGTLSLLGQDQPLTLNVTLNKSGAYPFGHKRFVLGISARGSLKRSAFGMDYGVANGLVGDDVQLVIETEGMAVE